MFRLTASLALLAPLLGACSSKWSYVDQDGDGFSIADGDCWDNEEGPSGSSLGGGDIFPGAPETWYDGFDNDCAGDNDFDADADGFVPTAYVDQAEGLPGGDCDDTVPTVNPGALDDWYDGVDADCSGNDDYDQDADGYVSDDYEGLATSYVEGSGALPGNDCDDLLDSVNPDASDEWYDGVDTDCGGEDDYDQDGDGYVPLDYADLPTTYVPGSGSLEAGDCDDTDATRFPEPTATVVWYNGIDERCDENDGDQDGDGFWVSDYAARVAASGTGKVPLDVPTGRSGDCFDDADDRPNLKDSSDPLVPLYGMPALDPDEVYPGATDVAYDGVDADCAEDSDFDKDGDGYDSECLAARDGSLGLDCRDSDDPADCGDEDAAGLGALGIYPGAIDTWYDGSDANCDNFDDFDADYDGYIPDGYSSVYEGSLPDGDCDDRVAGVNPSETDTWYDGTDTDCSGNDDYDQDGDGYVPDAYEGRATTYVSGSGALPGNDCDDTVSTVNPSRTDTWYDGTDTNCSGNDDYDQDADGYVPTSYVGRATTYVSGSGALPGNDCDDTVSTVNPGRTDTWYDGVDTNCSGNDDYDADSDGYVPDSYVGRATTYVSGSGALPGDDCDDTTSSVNPSRTDTWYDGVDTNCSGNDDYDRDSDGYVPDAYSGLATTYVSGSGGLPDNDCDDTDAAVNPAATETWYDGVDQDCDDWSDYDADLDGQDAEAYGGTDCDDTRAAVYYGATEYCSTTYDDDCDDDTNDRNASGCATFNYDFDGDSYGIASTRCYCVATGYWDATNDDDCDDNASGTYPGATDAWYDGVDANCGNNDDYDADSDNYVRTIDVGKATTGVSGTGALPGNDCDDTTSTVNPSRTDTWYDGVDTNCSGNDDYDADSDGYVPTTYVGRATTYVSGSGSLPGNDCDDTRSAVSPLGTETCATSYDDDCDGSDNDVGATSCLTFYYDGDADGYGIGTTQCTCEESGFYSADNDDDCDDTDELVNPGGSESGGVEGLDDDCDEWIDEHLVAVGDLVITEMMINSIESGTETYEWFEVYNDSGRTLYLDGWFFEEVNSSGTNPYYPFFISPDAALQVDDMEYLVFCATSTIPGVTCDYVYRSNAFTDSAYGAADNGSHALSNTSGTIRLGLVYGTGATAVALDSVSYSSTFGYSNGVSAELSINHTDATSNDVGTNWCAATYIYSTDGGNNYGTPGEDNECAL